MTGDFRIHLEIDYVPFIWVMAIFFRKLYRLYFKHYPSAFCESKQFIRARFCHWVRNQPRKLLASFRRPFLTWLTSSVLFVNKKAYSSTGFSVNCMLYRDCNFRKTWSTKFMKILILKSKVLNPVSYCIRRRKLCKEWTSLRAVHGLETLFVLRKKYPYFRLKSKECIWKFIHTNQSYRQTPMMKQLAPTSNHFFSSSKSPVCKQSKLNQSLPFCVFPNQANCYHRCQQNLSRYHYQMYLRRIGNSSLGPLWTK